ncbi:MAG: Lrp/AsnC ligand binding domain-containing protein [Thaumarchaeota archaeon]|nr:Lrp/AsnC ligand binding domain-containing protein [Nitrososphaerota archaeon]MDE1867810.1 Lrp/AsnC ligand binding domain-containing protein [Nitrososphaerota archaeon]
MQRAYVLIICKSGTEQGVLEELKSLYFVKEVAKTFGRCDILAKIETKDIGELRGVIDFKIRTIPEIESTTILMCMKPFSEFLFA